MIHNDNACIIKVGDLLRNPGKLDTVVFEHVVLDDVAGLSSEGVSGTLLLQGVNDGSVKVIIQEATATVSSICDMSGESYDRIITITDFDARFSTDVDGEDEARVYDDLFPLYAQGESIDIYDLLCQSIMLQEPIVHIKPGKEYLVDEYSAEEDDHYDDIEDENQGNVIFH